MTTTKYKITVPLTGKDGNAFSILCRVNDALKRHGVSQEERNSYYFEAASGDYDHLLRVTAQWVEVT